MNRQSYPPPTPQASGQKNKSIRIAEFFESSEFNGSFAFIPNDKIFLFN